MGGGILRFDDDTMSIRRGIQRLCFLRSNKLHVTIGNARCTKGKRHIIFFSPHLSRVHEIHTRGREHKTIAKRNT